MTSKILIVGSGSQARYAIDNLKARRQTPAGLLDLESPSRIGQKITGIKIIGMAQELGTRFKPRQYKILFAYGNNARKRDLAQQCINQGFGFASAVSPQAVVSASAEIAEGCIINPGAVILANAMIGRHVIIHSGCVIEHDNVIGDFVNIAPGVTLAGRVRIGEAAYVYCGATVIPDITIGREAIVAAGAVVIHPVPDNGKVAGVPAAPMS